MCCRVFGKENPGRFSLGHRIRLVLRPNGSWSAEVEFSEALAVSYASARLVQLCQSAVTRDSAEQFHLVVTAQSSPLN